MDLIKEKKYKVYKLVSILTFGIYIGYTSKTLKERFNNHKSQFNYGNPNYSKMRDEDLKIEYFNIRLLRDFYTKQEALEYERSMIKSYSYVGYLFNKSGVDIIKRKRDGRKVSLLGVEFKSVIEASELLMLSKYVIYNRIYNKSEKFDNWNFI